MVLEECVVVKGYFILKLKYIILEEGCGDEE